MDNLQESRRGDIFRVYGSIQTESCNYIVLMNNDDTLYIPLMVPPHVKGIADTIIGDKQDKYKTNPFIIGVYWTLASLIKTHGCQVEKISIEKGIIDDKPAAIASIDVVQSNEIGTVMSRVPLALWEIPVVALMTKAKIVVYETEDDPFSIKLNVSKTNIMETVRTALISTERAIGIGDQDASQGPFEGQ